MILTQTEGLVLNQKKLGESKKKTIAKQKNLKFNSILNLLKYQ